MKKMTNVLYKLVQVYKLMIGTITWNDTEQYIQTIDSVFNRRC